MKLEGNMLPRRIAIFGSSTVYGTMDEEMGGFANRLRLWLESNDPRNRVYNLGLWGETTEGLIARIGNEASIRRPDLILLYPGFNDIRRQGNPDNPNSVSIDTFTQSMVCLLSESQNICNVGLITGFPFDETRTSPYIGSDWYYCLDDAIRYTDRLRALCEQRDVPVLDLLRLWEITQMTSLWAADGLHCNATGHKRLFEEVHNFVTHTFGDGT